MRLDHRLVISPHSGGGGSLLGNEEMFERHCAYWVTRVHGGVQWVGGGPTFVRNPLIPGFEPTGVGSNGPGLFRHPLFVVRMGELMNRLHRAGGFGSVQFVLQGGMPNAPSSTLSGYADHRIPHALSMDEIAWLIREYGECGARASEAGADAIELHANHDDLLQWFISPLTNRRIDPKSYPQGCVDNSPSYPHYPQALFRKNHRTRVQNSKKHHLGGYRR